MDCIYLFLALHYNVKTGFETQTLGVMSGCQFLISPLGRGSGLLLFGCQSFRCGKYEVRHRRIENVLFLRGWRWRKPFSFLLFRFTVRGSWVWKLIQNMKGIRLNDNLHVRSAMLDVKSSYLLVWNKHAASHKIMEILLKVYMPRRTVKLRFNKVPMVWQNIFVITGVQ